MSPHVTQRRTGRTLALAVASIRQACVNPGVPIYYIDREMNLRDIVASLVQSDYRLSPRVVLRSEWFRLDLPQPLTGWMPSEDFFTALPARRLGIEAGQRLAEMFGQRDLASDFGVSQRVLGAVFNNVAPGLDPAVLAMAQRLTTLFEPTHNRATRDVGDVEAVLGLTLSPEERAAIEKPEEPSVPPRSRLDRLLSDDD